MLTTRAIGSEGFGHEKMPCQRCQIFQIHETRQHIAPPLFDPAWIFVIPSDLNEV